MQASRNPWLSRAVAVALLAVLAACAAPTVINTQWVDPTFVAKPLRSILVVGITRDATNRRIYEDAMVAQLGTRGVKAAPSYRFGSEDGPMSQEAMQLAVKEAGATGVLLTRIVNVAQSVQVMPGAFAGPAPGFGFGGFYGFYGGMWASSFQTAPTITVQDNVAADTRLFEVKNFTVVWSASTTTTTAAGSGTSSALLQQFATLLANALAKDGMI